MLMLLILYYGSGLLKGVGLFPSGLEKELFVDASLVKSLVNKVLRELHEHYKNTYWSFAERFATLTTLLGEFHVGSPEK